MSTIVAADEPHGSRLASELSDEGVDVAALLRPVELVDAVVDASSRVWEALREADTVVLHASRAVLVPDVVAMCDRSGARIVALAARSAERRAASSFGLPEALPLEATGAEVAEAVVSGHLSETSVVDRVRESGAITVVWGPHGAPGRTTIAMALAAARARAGERVALVDADTHAPSIAQRLDIPDEAPGFPAACRATDYGVLDGHELTRLSAPVDLGENPIEVLTGINRPARWPELEGRRVRSALDAARTWVDHVVVDVGAALETDEEIVSDIDAPRRNQAALAALGSADRIVALASADPVGISRYVRGLARLGEIAPGVPISAAVNRMRSAPFGVDGTGQVRRALEQYTDLDRVAYLPEDARAADQALLAARPILPRRRAPLARAVERLAATL
ncbi:hypothetical protein [Microbacterium sp. G2-8]|uniref:AAA family ATPase n=1 Tax=Microbacterium sp. G2-8 TaxID=2842454 RepID=UPI001C8A9F44|nr:hypothetical protein [Microbacterium sp. G2-8]